MKSLILILGKGSYQLQNINEDRYTMAHYHLPGKHHYAIRTPFVGEAIIKLHTDAFDRVFIIGTPTSMWDTLYSYYVRQGNIQKRNVGDVWEELSGAVMQGDFTEKEHLLKHIADLFGKHHGVTTSCHVVPIGRTDDEIWSIFSTFTQLPIEDGEISIDITHGLRYQPFFLFLVVQYFLAVRSDLRFKGMYYGALELGIQHPDFPKERLCEIMNIKAIGEVLQWIQIADNFKQYGDSTKMRELLDRSKKAPKFRKAVKQFSQVLKTNMLADVADITKDLLSAIEEDRIHAPLPLQTMWGIIEKFPQELNGYATHYEKLLAIAEHHKKTMNWGLAVLVLWEAVIERFANIFNQDVSNMSVYQALSKIAVSDQLPASMIGGDSIVPFIKKTKQLRKWRNSIAHADTSEKVKSDEIAKTFNELYDYIAQMIRLKRFTLNQKKCDALWVRFYQER
jgi:CRISPR-associated Csx2 family protein